MPLTLCVENRIIKLCIVVREEGIREHTGGTAESGGVRQIPDKSEAPSNHGAFCMKYFFEQFLQSTGKLDFFADALLPV